MKQCAALLVLFPLLGTACSTSSVHAGSGEDSGPAGEGGQTGAPGTDGSSSQGDATLPDGAPPSDAALDALDTGAGIPPFVDPFDGAAGCPDGGYPIGTAPCTLELSLSGSSPLGDVLMPGYCTDENGSRSVFGFSSVPATAYGQGYDVNITFSSPIGPGVVGDQPGVTVQIVQNHGLGNTPTTWSTPTGACAIHLASDVCWFSEQVEYYLVSGTGHCTAPASAQPPDAGAPLTIGDFWFETIVYP